MSLIPAPRADPIKAAFVTEAEKILAKAVKQGDFDKGFAVINELYEQAETFTQVIGTGLDMLESAWDKFKHEEGGSFLDAAVRNTRLNPVTIRNRINVRKLLNSGKIPEHLLEEVASLGQKALIRIANTERGGYEIEENDWVSFAEAVNEQQVDAIARGIEDKKPRSNFVGLYHDEEGVNAYVKGEFIRICSWENRGKPSAEIGIKVAIARAGMRDRVEY